MFPNLYFPIEIGIRELPARLLTACVAAERGFNVVIGFQHDLLASSPHLPLGIFIFKGTNNMHLTNGAILRRIGHALVACEEENFGFCLDANPLTFNSDKLSAQCDLYLCMGQDEADYLARRYGESLPFEITGNARTDVLRPEFQKAFARQTTEIKQQYGKFTLINTNLGLINPANNYTLEEIFKQWTKFGVFGTETDVKKNVAEFNHFVVWEKNNTQALVHLMELLARHGRPTIVRPHPAENPGLWSNVATNLGGSNINVLEDTPLIPFMLAADIVVHAGCTTGLEALLLDVPVISLEVGDSPVNEYYLSNKVNLTYSDAPQAFEAITRHLQGDPFISDARPHLLSKLSHYLDDAESDVLASEKIADALENFANQRFAGSMSEPNLRSVSWVRSNASDDPYMQQKFNVSKDTIDEMYASMRSALDRFQSLEISQLADKIFLVSAQAL